MAAVLSTEAARCKPENRCRLVETRGGFSPALVAKQRKELRAAESTLKRAVAWGAAGVPRLVEAELYHAWVLPKGAVRADAPLSRQELVAGVRNLARRPR